MLPLMGFAQNDKPTKQHKFGVGLGYNFNSVMGDTIRPFEVSLRYKLNDKHTFQLYVPIRMKENENYTYSKLKNAAFSENLWGLGIKYDHSFFKRNGVDFILGLDLGYQNMNTNNFRNYYYDDYSMMEEWRIKRDVLYLGIPVGLRCVFDRFGIEMCYAPRLSILKLKEDGSYRGLDIDTGKEWLSGSYDVPLRKLTMLDHSISCSLFVYF